MPIPPERLVFATDQIMDSGGRRLAAALSSPVYKQNKIPGRTDHFTDTQAFSEFQQNSEGIYSVVNFLRLGYSAEALSIEELNQLAYALMELPDYLVLRKDSPLDLDKIPTPLIDAARAAAGIVMVTGVLFSRGIPLDEKLDPDTIYEFAETTSIPGSPNLFVASEGVSCPAPENVIKKVLDHMIYVRDQDAWAGSDSSGFTDYINPEEVDRILKFGILNAAFRQIIKNYDPKDPSHDLESLDPIYDEINNLLGYSDE